MTGKTGLLPEIIGCIDVFQNIRFLSLYNLLTLCKFHSIQPMELNIIFYKYLTREELFQFSVNNTS